MGPIVVFDKSFLQGLNIDEACWFDNFFLTNITPLFYVETLADLSKEPPTGRTAERVVRNLADKSPTAIYPNEHHRKLAINDLLGNKVEMSNRPVITGGAAKRSPEGKIGVHFKKFPEGEAMQRWKEGEFQDIERRFAKTWRQALSGLDFESLVALAKNIIPKDERFTSLRGIKEFVDELVQGESKEVLYLALEMQGVSREAHDAIVARYNREPVPFQEFAPYAAFVLRVDLFFCVALASGLISKDRPSNKIDLAYLYYLPFCMVFISSDNLHARMAPLFMEIGQTYVRGQDLKADLRQLDTYYSKLPEEIKKLGIMRFAPYPPYEIETLVGQLWDTHLKPWREHAKEWQEAPAPSKEESQGTRVEDVTRTHREAKPVEGPDWPASGELDYMIVERRVPANRGKWQIVSEDLKRTGDGK